MNQISSISESELIKRLHNIIIENTSPDSTSENIDMGIGDDAAIVNPIKNKNVVTTDTMVENTHFIYDVTNFRNLGWKLLATNYSDIAAMGCRPLHSVINLGLRENQKISDVEEMYLGFCDLINEFGGAIIGGDIVRSDTFFISITVTGVSEGNIILTRKKAKIGDEIFVTGNLGNSKVGLEIILNSPDHITSDNNKSFIEAHTRPTPKIQQGLDLVRACITTAMDISDGLLNDLKKMCDSSDVGAEIYIESIPVDKHLKNMYPEKWDEKVVQGGEDYELLFTASSDSINILNDISESEFFSIGKVTEKSSGIKIIDSNGKTKTYNEVGWDHFKGK
ncbi:MAG: thiamine-phosphate kinase [Chloroflexi bacterium]|nr:thiamine-phosphate kinase [Chloroflexota bacterium]|tara:strand:+ start:2838 stop:3845 length:1008 start_codon:yes stop_codon:yes gene_type:complete